jgi:hypothetical protein
MQRCDFPVPVPPIKIVLRLASKKTCQLPTHEPVLDPQVYTRGIPRPDNGWPPVIRWHPGIQAIVVAVTSDDGQVVAIQRIYLTPAAEKDRPKMSLGPVSEGAVRLPGDPDGPLLLAEGIETGLSVGARRATKPGSCLDQVPKQNLRLAA